MIENYKRTKLDFKNGTVILAGAGPGSEDLITLKVDYALRIADVIIYDALVNSNLLKKCRKKAKLIYAGKLKNKQACSQNDINEWMLFYARKKKKVLRLKGGDVSFFSRGSQEISYLKKNKIDCKVLTGITCSQVVMKILNESFFNKSSVCSFITGHKKINKHINYLDLNMISKNEGRIIIYMGVGQIGKITSELIKSRSPIENVYIISNASLPNQQIFHTTLKDCKKTVIKEKIKPPSIFVIGN
ncbi:MAG: uroporphyrinogen-III C-methyltransferase [Pseudomonadota bacterium]|nr:uroporphyrinogen-III C-methyltransferase [Pseudomonadota bacterium]